MTPEPSPTDTQSTNPPANPPATPPTGDNGSGTNPSATPQTWEAFTESMTPEAKALYEQHTQGLRNTVAATRKERDALAGQLTEITKTLGKDPAQAKQMLDQATADLALATQRADFFEQAIRPEVGCTNPALAFIAAREAGAIDQKGRVNWDALKTAYPELFQKKIPAAGAGSGTQSPPQATTMNEFIRAAAGR